MNPSRPLLLSTLLAATALSAEEPPESPWTLTPSAYLFGGLDRSSGVGYAPLNGELAEPSPNAGLGASLDLAGRGDRADVQATFLGVVRHPHSTAERVGFAAGRVRAQARIGEDWRLVLDDSAKLQRRGGASPYDFQRNEVAVALERQRARLDLGLEVSDRRRSLPDLPILGFDRQALTATAALRLGRAGRIGVQGGLQWYSARTASGSRWVSTAEATLARRRTVLALRASWFEPREDRRLSPAAPEPVATRGTPAAEVGSYARDSFFAGLARSASEPPSDPGTGLELPVELLLLDPLETDADEWDFGRRKRILAATLTRRLASRWNLSASALLQHRRGPNLLFPAPTSPVYEETRFTLRLGARGDLTRRLAVLFQASHLSSAADRPELDYSRTLAALGVQVRF